MIRLFDILISLIGLIICLPILSFLFLLGLLDTGSPLFFQKRVGINLKCFTLIKFRTMKIGTRNAATYLISSNNITLLGHFMRKFKIDEGV